MQPAAEGDGYDEEGDMADDDDFPQVTPWQNPNLPDLNINPNPLSLGCGSREIGFVRSHGGQILRQSVHAPTE